jgi:dihydroorotase-like cyclic amidohydrolase
VKLVDEDSNGYLCVSRTKLRQDVRCNVVVANDVMELEAIKLVLELADFHAVGVHVLHVAIPRLVDLVDDHCGRRRPLAA